MRLLACIVLLVVCTDVSSEASQPVIRLWDDGPPETQATPTKLSITERGDPDDVRDRFATSVTDPELVVFPAANPSGKALLIIPGGGYRRVVLDKEGYETAEWFSKRGITCFVLMYRLPGEGWSNGAEVPLQDAQRALRQIRARSSEYGYGTVGVLGFSAGGHVAASLATRFEHEAYPGADAIDDLSVRPDFAVLLYPVISMDSGIEHTGSREALLGSDSTAAERRSYSVEQNVPPAAPPMFLLHAADDGSVPVENATRLFEALRVAHVPVELHVFSEGGHGFGMRYATDGPVSHWPFLVQSWIESLPEEGRAQVRHTGSNRYRNPIIFADYSDPDVVRVGTDFYMAASSFNAVPGLPILHSTDLVSWQLISHAIDRFDDPAFDIPQHGNGVWAPAIRYHDGTFYIFYGDPDRGIFMVRARDPRRAWDDPVLVKAGTGLIDPAPLWDDDGRAYLVHAFAKSRAGFNSVLHVAEMSPDGTRLLGDSRQVFDGREHHPTIEGPKIYKRNGYYYIFAPAGGVKDGWQTVLRARDVFGPYEDRIVLARGRTEINGPHQGAYVELDNGEPWFVHFQEHQPYGRIVHLQPVVWKDGWPVIGQDPDGDGTGEPVIDHEKPDVGRTYAASAPRNSDDFDAPRLGLQWQWQANDQPGWYSLTDRVGTLRLFAQPMRHGESNLWPVPNLLLQKFPAPAFTTTTSLMLAADQPAARSGLVVMGSDYAYLALQRTAGGFELVQARAIDAAAGTPEEILETVDLGSRNEAFLRARVFDGGLVRFSYSVDGVCWVPVGEPFEAQPGRWVGAKIGLFALYPTGKSPGAYADATFFRIQ